MTQADEFDRLLELRQSGVLDETTFNSAWARLVASQVPTPNYASEPVPVAVQSAQAPPTPPGWYPDSHGVTRFWDGQQWTTHVAPPPAPHSVNDSGPAKNALALIGTAVTAVGAAVAALTQVSVASGMGSVWLGLGISIIGAITAWVGGARLGLKVLCAILVIIAIASATYDQHQIDQKRKEIQQILNTP